VSELRIEVNKACRKGAGLPHDLEFDSVKTVIEILAMRAVIIMRDGST